MFNNNGFGNFNSGFSDNSDIGGLGNNNLLGNQFANQNMLQQTYDFGTHSQTNNSREAISIELRKVYLGLTRPQSNQQRRSYDVRLSGHGEQAIQEQVDQHGISAFDPANISNLLAAGANFIHHAGTPEAPVTIENGWQADRFRFTIVADVFRNGVFQRTEFISGYTNHAGVNNAGLISTVTVDPGMIFSINHITEARVRQMDGLGRPMPMISRSNGVVRNMSYRGLGQGNLYLTRPGDILRAVDKVDIYSGMAKSSELGQPLAQTYQDMDSMLTHVPMMSSDTNQLIPTFTSRALKGLLANSLNQFDPMNMDGQGNGNLAAMNAQDTPFTHSGFVHVMNRIRANGVHTTAQFTFGDLIWLDPSVDDRTEVFGRSYESGKISIPFGTSVSSIGDAETIAVHATSIVHSTLALMSMAGVATLAYNATNGNTGQGEVTLQACDGVDTDGKLWQRLEALKTRLLVECLNLVASDGSTYEVDVFADAFNDVFIQLTWDGVRRDYVIPAYAISNMAPTVTDELPKLIGMAQAIKQVVTSCKEIINPNGTEQPMTAIQGDGSSRYSGLAGEY